MIEKEGTLTKMNLRHVLLFHWFSCPFYLRNVFIASFLMLLHVVGNSEWGCSTHPPKRGLVYIPPRIGMRCSPLMILTVASGLAFPFLIYSFLIMGNYKPSFIKTWFRLSSFFYGLSKQIILNLFISPFLKPQQITNSFWKFVGDDIL